MNNLFWCLLVIFDLFYLFLIIYLYIIHLNYKFNVLDIPNAGAGLKSLPKRMKWDEDFRNYLKELDNKKPVVLTGDLNVAHQEIGMIRFFKLNT